jgi:hypothetical protein
MHHKDPAAPGHQSTSNGLLPAFNGNTKPLKYRALDQLFALEFLSHAMDRGRHGPRRDRPYRLGFRAAWQSPAVGLWKHSRVASSGAGTAVAGWPRTGLDGVAN